ncbi:unnamed protein product [Miscanthus lutarioriparius]|uniref:Uncharacterized protein n=1 Tax=Miscanthus lutarioriparius TaxID=422564 RepID=A0A811M330_9POAL|nr:unnamed protein product [Miscanthus lutarioriparius]
MPVSLSRKETSLRKENKTRSRDCGRAAAVPPSRPPCARARPQQAAPPPPVPARIWVRRRRPRRAGEPPSSLIGGSVAPRRPRSPSLSRARGHGCTPAPARGHEGLGDHGGERRDREGGLDLAAAAPPGPDVHDGRGGRGQGTGIAGTSGTDQGLSVDRSTEVGSTATRRCDQRHGEVGDSSGLLVSGIFSADKISVIDKAIVNSAVKSNYMSAGQISVPIVFRGPNDQMELLLELVACNRNIFFIRHTVDEIREVLVRADNENGIIRDLMSKRGRGIENGMQQCPMKRGVKETRNAVRDGNTTNGMDENSDKLHMHSTNSNVANELSDGNTTNEMDENSDWLHRQSTYSNGLQQLSGYLLAE